LESQVFRFVSRELEHEIRREPVEVAFHRFVQIAGSDAVKGCQVSIQHHLFRAYKENGTASLAASVKVGP
jgi:hypothetical protein